MEAFQITGSNGARTLMGKISVSGCKNAVLPALAAALIFDTPVAFTNVPALADVDRVAEAFTELGALVVRTKHRMTIDPRGICTGTLSSKQAGRMRASVLFIGPLLARLKETTFPHPGGCVIGERPIDLFLSGFQKMGATVRTHSHSYHLSAKNGLHGARIVFPIASVTATETFLTTALVARGTTVLENAALEPEIAHLARFLVRAGARIEGIGTPTLTIHGTGGLLKKKSLTYITPPDRIEAGSYLILAALAGKDVTVGPCPIDELSALFERMDALGVKYAIRGKQVRVRAGARAYRGISIKTHEYPGFPTDLQAPMAVLMTQADGASRIFETIFEGRLGYADDLKKMGAKITVWSAREATIEGKTRLRGKELYGPDIRAGLAYLMAASIAKGTSLIHNAHLIDRGYERIEHKLAGIGVNIERLDA